VCAPPLLATVTRGLGRGPSGDAGLACALGEPAVPVDTASPSVWVEVVAFGESDESALSMEPEDSVEPSSADAIPGVLATATPMPSATASAPTRPMYVA